MRPARRSPSAPARRVLRAALAYAGLVFAAGVVLGTVRTLVLAPAVGPLAAVLVELPLMLGLAWLALRPVLRRWPVPPRAAPRLAMGALGFVALMGLELALGMLAFGQTLGGLLADRGTPHGLAGLAGQVVFALLPWLRAAGAGR